MADALTKLDYPNFKSKVAEQQGHGRAAVMGRGWHVFHRLSSLDGPANKG